MAEITETTLRQWIVNLPDGRVREAVGTVEFEDGHQFPDVVRGVWKVQLLAGSDLVPISTTVELRDPRREPFTIPIMGDPVRPGTPIFVDLVFSAPDNSAPLFWEGALRLNVTLNMV